MKKNSNKGKNPLLTKDNFIEYKKESFKETISMEILFGILFLGLVFFMTVVFLFSNSKYYVPSEDRVPPTLENCDGYEKKDTK